MCFLGARLAFPLSGVRGWGSLGKVALLLQEQAGTLHLAGWLVLTEPAQLCAFGFSWNKGWFLPPNPLPPGDGSLSLAQTQARSWWGQGSRGARGRGNHSPTPLGVSRCRSRQGSGEKGPLFPGFWGSNYCQGYETL